MAKLLRRYSEEEFTAQVLELAGHCGWIRAHFRPARTAKGWRTPVSGDGKGFLDLLLLRRGVLVVAELKVGGGKLSREQELWIAEWRKMPDASVYVWTPDDWEEIKRVLIGR